MESTSVYWIPVWCTLDGHFKLKLINSYFIKQLPGHKSDVKDAEWIATCLQKKLVSSSFVPEERIQSLRQYDRRIFDLSASISRNLVKLDQCVQRCNIRISNYVSTTDSKGYRSIVRLLSQGVTDAEVLVEGLHGRTIVSIRSRISSSRGSKTPKNLGAMKNTFSVIYYLKRQVARKDGTVPVMGRITVDGITDAEHLLEFLEMPHHVKDIALKELAPAFISDFEMFLRTDNHCRTNTMWLYTCTLRTMVLIAINNEWLTCDPFREYEVKKEETTREILTKEEQRMLMDGKQKNTRQELYRDLYLFCAFTGLSFADMHNLREKSSRKTLIIGVYLLFSCLPTSHTCLRSRSSDMAMCRIGLSAIRQ